MREELDRLVALTAERRYIEAGELLGRVRAALAASAPGRAASTHAARLDALLGAGGALEALPARHAASLAAAAGLQQDAGWTLYADRDGQRTQYRREGGTFAVRIEANVEGVRPADTLYIWREAGLYSAWFPLISRSAVLHAYHPSEVALHLVIDKALLYADLALHGWACDDLRRGGRVLICVRPLDAADLPAGVAMPALPSGRRAFPAQRVPASVDILVEPRGERSVRFAYCISYPLHPSVPTWAVNLLLGQGMATIFANMRLEAERMAAGDASASRHLARMKEPDGAAVARWLAERIDPHVAAASAAASAAPPGGAAGRPLPFSFFR